MDVSHLLESLEGPWCLSRRIEPDGATMRGTAQFTRVSPDVLSYEETGWLTLGNGNVLQSTRRYRFRAQQDGMVIDFDDGPDAGKIFVTLTFATTATTDMVAADRHHCGDDVYAVQYKLRLPHAYDTVVSVTGPKKDYRITTQYVKADR